MRWRGRVKSGARIAAWRAGISGGRSIPTGCPKAAFYNERHTSESDIEVQMTLVFKDCGIVPR
jgi:hypothetical protein